MQSVRCQDRREVLDERPDILPERRTPCPTCGSLARWFEVAVNESISLHESVGIKARRGGSGRPFLEAKFGASFFRKTKKWLLREMTVDRENDKYKELVTNPETGEIIHQCEERLSEHRVHGSARTKN